MQNSETLMSKHLVHIFLAAGINKKIRSVVKELQVTWVLTANCYETKMDI